MNRFAACLVAVCVVSSACAQTRTLANPTELASTRTGRDLNLLLEVKYADFSTYNPTTGKNDPVHLRTYNGRPVGPTIRMLPGDILHAKLKNDLPEDPTCHQTPDHDHNTPNCFNITNLHTHGFHVSPSDNSDNVLLEIQPQKSFDFKFDLPADHPAGTFWYHSHRHGSTALQTSSGMEGALIVKGTRTYADKAKNGIADIDTVLKQTGGKRVTERIALFQQIQYSCLDAQGKLTWNCGAAGNKDNIGRIEGYEGGQFGPKSWDTSQRFTTINGITQPSVPVHAAQIYRWRLIHGGVRDTIALRITRARPQSASGMLALAKGIAAQNEQTWTAANCLVKQTVPQFEFATDGLTRREIAQKQINILQPGYRSDILTVFPEKGVYCVLDDSFAPKGNINSEVLDGTDAELPKDRRLLALVVVRGDGKVDIEKIKDYLGTELYKGNPELPQTVRDDLRALKIAEFSPHADLPPDPSYGAPRAIFNVNLSDPAKAHFEVNGKSFESGRIDQLLKLGATDEWTLGAQRAGHPYHIHVNPFQIVSITRTVKDAGGNPVQESIFDGSGHCTELDLKDKDGKPSPDPQYCDQIGVFRDTIFVKQDYEIKIRSHYETFAGDFVLHCHILDHEDEGMMQNVRIDDPAHPNTGPFGGGMPGMHH